MRVEGIHTSGQWARQETLYSLVKDKDKGEELGVGFVGFYRGTDQPRLLVPVLGMSQKESDESRSMSQQEQV